MEESWSNFGDEPWHSHQAAEGSQSGVRPPQRQDRGPLSREEGSSRSGDQNWRGNRTAVAAPRVHARIERPVPGYSDEFHAALRAIYQARNIREFSIEVVHRSNRLQGRDKTTFLQKAAVDFDSKFVPRLEEDIVVGHSLGYATTCNAVSKEAGGQAGIEACRALAARISGLHLALIREIEPKALSLLASSFGRDPLSTKCRDGTIRIAQISHQQSGALDELSGQDLSLFANGFSKWPEEAHCRQAIGAIANEILLRGTQIAGFVPQDLSNLANGFGKWPKDEGCCQAAGAIANEVVGRAGRGAELAKFTKQELSNLVNCFSKWPEKPNMRQATAVIANEVIGRAERGAELAKFTQQELSNLVNGFSKWPEEPSIRQAAVAIASEVVGRAERDLQLSDFSQKGLAVLAGGFVRWPEGCQGAIVAIAGETRRRAERDLRLSDFLERDLRGLARVFSKCPKEVNCCQAAAVIAREVLDRAERHLGLPDFVQEDLSILAKSFSKWPESSNCHEATVAIANEVLHRAERDIGLSDFFKENLTGLANGFCKWPKSAECRSANVAIAREVAVRAERLTDFTPQELTNLVNSFSKWPQEEYSRHATVAIAIEVLLRVERNVRLSDLTPRELTNLVNGFSKWPDETGCRDATLAIAGEICRRADRLFGFDPQALANLVNGFSKWPDETGCGDATLVVAGEVCRRTGLLSGFDPQALANLVNGCSKWSDKTGCGDAVVAIAGEVLRRANFFDFTAPGLANLLNGFSKWPEEEACHQVILGIARKLGSGGQRFGGFTTVGLGVIANNLARAVMRAGDAGEIEEAALLKGRLHELAHYLHYASDCLEQADALSVTHIFKALAKAQLFEDLGSLARPGLDRLTELHRAPGFVAENNLESMGNLSVALLPLARSPHKDLRQHRRQALNLLNDLQPIVEHKIEAHLKAGDAERIRGPCSSRCPALSIYQVLKARAVLATLFRRPHVEGKKSDLRVRRDELQCETKTILDKTGGLVQGDLSNMSWNLIAEIEAESPVDALDTFMAQNAATIQSQYPASVFDVHKVLQAMDHEPRPPQGEAGLMQLPVVDMQGRPLATEPETRYSIFHRLTSGAVKVVAVQLPGRPSPFMLARTLTVEGVPYRMDLCGGSKLKPPRKTVSQIAGRVPGEVGAESSGGKLLAIPYAETAPGTAFDQLSRAWAPFKEAYYYTQRRGFAAPPAIKDLGPRDYALEGAFNLLLLPDRPANQEHPFKLTGPGGPIALRPHDGCGFIKASLAKRIPAVRQAGRQEGPDRVSAFGEGRRSSLPASALQHYPRSEPVADEAREKTKTWLESRQGQRLTAEELFRTVTGGHIDGPGAVAVPSGDECLHVPKLKSETLMTRSGVLIGRSPYDKPNLRPFAAERVKSAVDGDPTAVFLDNCTAIQYSFNAAQKSGEELASDDPVFFAKGILIVVPDKMWPATYAHRGLVMSAEDVKSHSSWAASKDRAKVDTEVECVGILQATEVFARGSLVAVPTGEQKKLDGDFDGDTIIIIGDRPQLYEHVREFDQKEQARGFRTLKPPKSHTPAIEGDNYQFGRASQILNATQDVLETYSGLQRSFLAQSHEARRWFAKRAVFGTYEGVNHELRREIGQLLGQEQVSSEIIQDKLARAKSEIEVAKHPVGREIAELLVADLQAWAVKPDGHLLPETVESVNDANTTLSTALSELFPDLAETYPATPQPRGRIRVLLDHYPARIDPRPDGYDPDDLVQSANNLLSLGIKIGTDAYKSDTGTRLFSKKSQNLQRLLHATPGLKSVPYVKGLAAALNHGRFDVDAALKDLKGNPTLTASVMEISIDLATKQRILPEPSRLRPAAEGSDEAITLTREEASRRAQIEIVIAKAEERKITEATREVAASLDQANIQVNMPHLEHPLRSHASMAYQLTGMNVPPGSVPQLISSAVRHVFEIRDKDFTRAFKKALLAFEERGYTERQTTNWFRMRDPTFAGIKTILTTPEAYRFEVEFHTPDSHQAKLANHDTYKVLHRLRREPRGDPLAQAETEQLVQRTREVCAKIAIPDGALDIPHWEAEGERSGGSAAAFGLRSVEQSRMPQRARSPEASEIVVALGARPIVLVGLPSAGKSTIGSAVAKRLGLHFIDTDQKIQKEAGRSITQIIDDHGEAHFRELEAKVIARVLKQGPAVIATGGGSFIHEQTRRLIGEKAVSIWLDTDPDRIRRRLRNDTTRPLLRGFDRNQKITQLTSERTPFYVQADVRVVPPHKQDKKNADPCVKALHDYLCPAAADAQPAANPNELVG